MGLEENAERDKETRIAVSEDRLKNVLYEFKDDLVEQIEGKFATKSDVKLWVALGLVGGSAVTSLITAVVARISPPAQASAIAHAVASLFA